ncbi:MAG: ABC transporter permease [Candidatus Peregrinibacteria bacterium]
MNFEYFWMAFDALMANKVRTFLSMLGVIIGVSTVIAVVGIGLGAQEKISEQYKNMSVESLLVMGGGGGGPAGGGGRQTASSKLSDKDIAVVLENSGNIRSGTASYSGNSEVSFGKVSESKSVVGIQDGFFTTVNLHISHGEAFTETQYLSRDKIVILGATLAKDLFGTEVSSAVGQTITVGGKKFQVAGILAQNGVSSRMASYDDSAFVPYLTAQKSVLGSKGRVMLMFLAKSVSVLPTAMEEVTATLRENHKLKSTAEDDFRIFDAGSMVASAQSSAQTLTILLTSVAAIVLIVSGIGIMNVMFVTVVERTKEIGILKAIGARQGNILLQFLLEAMMLSVLGGLLGIALGESAIPLLNKLDGWYLLHSTQGVLIAFVFSVSVGIFFGFYPALKASRLDPVDALRSE